MLRKLFEKESIEIIPIKTIEKEGSTWGGEGIIFYLKNGKGKLRQIFN